MADGLKGLAGTAGGDSSPSAAEIENGMKAIQRSVCDLDTAVQSGLYCVLLFHMKNLLYSVLLSPWILNR